MVRVVFFHLLARHHPTQTRLSDKEMVGVVLFGTERKTNPEAAHEHVFELVQFPALWLHHSPFFFCLESL